MPVITSAPCETCASAVSAALATSLKDSVYTTFTSTLESCAAAPDTKPSTNNFASPTSMGPTTPITPVSVNAAAIDPST